MVADRADGADGVVGPVLAHGRYPDGPRSQPPLAAKTMLTNLVIETNRFESTAQELGGSTVSDPKAQLWWPARSVPEALQLNHARCGLIAPLINSSLPTGFRD
jgi:hypothetical protein